MSRFGLFTIISGILQIIVPTYGLRLLRRFGSRQVGWFLVAAFAALALAHLLEPLRPQNHGPIAGVTLDGVYAAASILLLVGMAHIDGLFSERGRIDQQERHLRAEWETREEEVSASCRDLQQEIARLEREAEALRDSEAHYRLLFVENPQPMWILDLRSLELVAVNQCARRLYGLGPKELGPAIQLVPPQSAAAFRRDAARPCPGAEFRGSWQHCRRDGTTIEVEITAVDLNCAGWPARLILATDVSERHRREQSSAQAEKLEITGRLAGRFAHHFNNLLTIIDGHATMLLHKPLEPLAEEPLKQISAAAGRAAVLTRQLLAAGGRQLVQREPIQLKALVEDLRPMLRRLVQDSIIVECTWMPDLPPILADAHAIEHVIVNLALNARDAMPTGGALRITSKLVRLNDGEAERGGRAGEFVCLEISDTGCGIPPEAQSYLFEPFFTTSDIGKGTGLGLASVFGTVKQLGGWIEYSTQVGIGTDFRLYFPVAVTSAGPPKNATPAAEEHGRRIILVLEEDERTRGLARSALNGEGYHVIEADSVTTAMLLFGRQVGQINVVMLDLFLADGISTHGLANSLRAFKPGLKVLYTCAREISAKDRAALTAEGAAFIQKPYTPDELLCAVQNRLGEAG